MNLFKQINDFTMKVAKGMIAIFAIKLILFVSVFTFQACTTDENSSIEIDNSAFKNALKTSTSDFNNISLFNTNGLMAKISDGNKTIHLTKDTNQDLSDTSFLNTINDLESLVVVKNEHDLELTDIVNNGDELVASYTMQLQPIQEALSPSIQEAKNYLYSKGFNDQTIDEMIIEEGGIEEDLILLVMSMTEIENGNSFTYNNNNFSNLFFNSAYAQQNAEITAAEVGHCAAVAIGADVLWSLGSSSASAWSMAAIKRAFGAVAKRLLGPIGVAIAVVSFGICLYDAALD